MIRPDSAWTIAYLTLLVAMGQMSTGIYLPAMPSLTGIFATDGGTVALTLTVFLAGFAVAQLVYGPLCDRYGRRPVLLGGLAIYTAASLACALAPSIEWLIAARLFQAIGACSGQVLARAMGRDLYDGPRYAKVMALIGLALAATPAAGPVLGGVLQVLFGWQASFFFLFGWGGLLLCVTFLGVRETLKSPDPTALDVPVMARNFGQLLRNRLYMGYTLTLAFTFGTMFTYMTGAPFILIDSLGIRPDIFGVLSVFNVVGYAIGSFLANKLSGRVAMSRLVAIGACIVFAAGLAMLGLALAGLITAVTVIGPMMAMLIGMGLMIPSAMAGAIGPFPQIAGVASALMGFLQMGIAMLMSLLVGLLHGLHDSPMQIAFAFSASLVLLSYLTLVRRRPA
ncbi:multidrug effflux MFS transporter [Oceanibaculum pacificum]|uniref:Bcr/CflA family efflux transporter n=1 Tax=Oceanibaculum pacificum TaxID=580166 RepID=A0A154WH18_9PROT|nr:multidrug effflux MFS transporter [Oceanibaculum pacificum]KZD12807.1 hypothetical protein AUP43_00245 [Oceanibaculum pacificum]